MVGRSNLRRLREKLRTLSEKAEERLRTGLNSRDERRRPIVPDDKPPPTDPPRDLPEEGLQR